jgi:predicted nucleic acid-binding Zn ribbon protein
MATSANSLSISDALVAFLRENDLEQSVLDVQVEEAWPRVMGETITNLTRSIEVKNGMLIVHVNSAALKAQLFENRFELVRKLNEAVGANAIKDCRILG